MSPGNVKIVRRTQLASYVSTALMVQTTKAIELGLTHMLRAAVIVETPRVGMKKAVASDTRASILQKKLHSAPYPTPSVIEHLQYSRV